ncbi:MAG: arylesterase [Lachnospiraceae bacterium]|nr:arylesterase [Lachnospiraceae bacterium]
MNTILAFGDSNTWGLIPGSRKYERYPWNKRWTGILQESLCCGRIVEEGLCGRTTVFEDEFRQGRRGINSLPLILESQQPISAAIVMLGTNDCKKVYHASSYNIGKGIELCIDEIEKYIPADRILLVSPIHLGENVWYPDKDPEFRPDSVKVSRELDEVYRKIAKDRGTAFLVASDHAKADTIDDEHLNEEGHKALAKALCKKLKEMKVA